MIRDAFRPLRTVNFRQLWVGNMATQMTLFMHTMASVWLAYELNDSPLFLGVVGMCRSLPMAVMPFLGGAVADRWNRRHVLIMCQIGFLLNAGCMAILIFLELVQPWYLLVHVGLFGTLMSINTPTRQAFMANTVESAVLRQTVTLHFATQSMTRVIGPGLAGYVVQVFGGHVCYVMQAALYMFAIAFIWRIDVPDDGKRTRRENVVRGINMGLSYVSSNRIIFSLIGLTSLIGLVGLGHLDMLPVFSDNILGGGPVELGMMMTAGGVGALIGMLILMGVGDANNRGTLLVMMVGLLGCALIAFSNSVKLVPALIFLGLAGMANTTLRATNNSLLQERVPDEFRGRLMGIESAAYNGLKAIGSFSVGYIATAVNAPFAITACGVILLTTGILTKWRIPIIAKLR